MSLPAPSDILQHAVYAMELNVEECGDVYTALAELKQVQCAWCVGAVCGGMHVCFGGVWVFDGLPQCSRC